MPNQSDQRVILDGFTVLDAGMDSGRAPSLIEKNQCAYLENMTVRTGYPETRPGWKKIPLSFESGIQTAFEDGRFQGAKPYTGAFNSFLLASISGQIYRITIKGDVIEIAHPSRSSVLEQAWFEQVENDMVIQNGQEKAAIFNGSDIREAEADEVPVGTAMAYGNGRLWVTLPSGYDFVAGDLFGTDTGPLKFTENSYLAEGGTFSVRQSAGQIRGMLFSAVPDTGLGQGELLVGTENSVFAVNPPVDRDEWKNLSYPIQRTLLIGYGAMNPLAFVTVNSDVFMRSRDGLRSVIQARRDFSSSGNTPVSSEMERVLKHDSENLLRFGSAVVFDNRLLITVNPVRSGMNVWHRGVMALNMATLASMRKKLPPAFDGYWTGPAKPIQFLKGIFSGVERCLMFALGSSGKIELWEQTKSDSSDFDGATDIPVAWSLESRSCDFGKEWALKELKGRELWVDSVEGPVSISTTFKSDQAQAWRAWSSAWVISGVWGNPTPSIGGLPVSDTVPEYRPRNLLPQPEYAIDPLVDRPYHQGQEHQVKLEGTGHARLKRLVLRAWQAEEDVSAP